MKRERNPNIEILELALDQLGELADEMVFLGGCATGLLITDTASAPIRATKDVDAIVQVASHAEYYQLADKLRMKGFSEDMNDGAPICRWISVDVVLDVMPTEEEILGFGNKWYRSAIDNSVSADLPSGKKINMVSAPYFLITKLDAFEGRGNGDYLLSHDIEDIVAVLDGRSGIEDEVANADRQLANVLARRFRDLLDNERFVDAIYGHMPTDTASQGRVELILSVIRKIAGIK